MKWLRDSQEYNLTTIEADMLECLDEHKCPTRPEWLNIYETRHNLSQIGIDLFAQRMKSIYSKFEIDGQGAKLPQLYRLLKELYTKWNSGNETINTDDAGLTNVYPDFPIKKFRLAIQNAIDSPNLQDKKVDILQTFAPNLQDYSQDLICCLNSNIQVRILLAWPYSRAAKLREEVLRKYAKIDVDDENDIRHRTIGNLEKLGNILVETNDNQLLNIKMYDTLPSMAIHRAGNYLLAAPFLHRLLAVDTFQLELKIGASNSFVTNTLLKDFDLMWDVSRSIRPIGNRNCWQNDLNNLFRY